MDVPTIASARPAWKDIAYGSVSSEPAVVELVGQEESREWQN